ncbi:hypothetical protein NDU88_001085 [Pleurodeles waltl]|uniref:Uncharacterized protein n=1 Tax=Pleurodeles waltl TaxID=8319 RepID=A0AAV7L8I8_PLEWA|nr:hypothetical protein NDU88_001085 [Pleurodeles waltl]
MPGVAKSVSAAEAVFVGDPEGTRRALACMLIVYIDTPLDCSKTIMRQEGAAQGMHAEETEEAALQDEGELQGKQQDGRKKEDASDRARDPRDTVETSLSAEDPPSIWMQG